MSPALKRTLCISSSIKVTLFNQKLVSSVSISLQTDYNIVRLDIKSKFTFTAAIETEEFIILLNDYVMINCLNWFSPRSITWVIHFILLG